MGMTETKLKQIIEVASNTAANKAARIVKEEMQSQFKIFGEKLNSIDSNVIKIGGRVDNIEDKVSLHEIAIKNAI